MLKMWREVEARTIDRCARLRLWEFPACCDDIGPSIAHLEDNVHLHKQQFTVSSFITRPQRRITSKGHVKVFSRRSHIRATTKSVLRARYAFVQDSAGCCRYISHRECVHLLFVPIIDEDDTILVFPPFVGRLSEVDIYLVIEAECSR